MKRLILLCSMMVLCRNAFAQDKPCTKSEEMQALSSVLSLNNWEDIYASFNKYRHCDDGAIAEGYSDAIARLLANRWDELKTLVNLASSDKKFYAFVLSHIDATADRTDIGKIIANSSKCCPKSAESMCSEIEKAARRALQEIDGVIPAR